MVLLVNWDLRSVNLLDFLLPAEIDWSMTDPRLSALITTDVPPEAEGVFKQVFDPGPPENAAPAAELLVKFAQMKVVRVICFQHLEKPFHGQLEGISSSSGGNMTDFYMKFACMFKSMFRPSPALQASVESHTRKVYKQYPAAYMAWHLRAGGQVGEEKPMSHLIPQHSRLSQILYGLVCAQELGATLSLSTRTTPIMFSTDLNPLRDLVIAGVIPMLAAPDFKAHHFDHDVKATHEDNHNVFVDLLMMSRARCLLTHVSGFSHIAVAWGGALSGRLCWTDLVSCIRAKPHVFGGVVI